MIITVGEMPRLVSKIDLDQLLDADGRAQLEPGEKILLSGHGDRQNVEAPPWGFGWDGPRGTDLHVRGRVQPNSAGTPGERVCIARAPGAHFSRCGKEFHNVKCGGRPEDPPAPSQEGRTGLAQGVKCGTRFHDAREQKTVKSPKKS